MRYLTMWNRTGWRLMVGLIVFGLIFSGCSSSKNDSAAAPRGEAIANGSAGVSEQNKIADSITFSENKAKVTSGSATSLDVKGAQVTSAAPAAGASSASVNTDVKIGGFSTSADGMNRKVIYRGNLSMEVADYSKAQTEINSLIALHGGYLLQFNENQSTKDQSGTYVIKVPANGFTSFMSDLEKVDHLSPIRHNIQGQDVSEEYVDLESRLKAKQVVEARLLSFMEKAQKTDELVSFSNELAKVQEAIEQIKGRMRYLDQNVAFSTIELHLYQKGAANTMAPASGDSLLSSMKKALKSSLHVMVSVVQGLLVFFAAVVPILVAAAVIVIPLIYFYRRNKKMSNSSQGQYHQIVEVKQEPEEPTK